MKPWELFLTQLDKDLGKTTVDRWLRTLRVARFDAGNLYLEAKDSFQQLWFQEHILEKAKKNLSWNGRQIKIHFLGDARKKKKVKVKETAPLADFSPDRIDEKITFDNFICEKGNEIPLKLLRALDFSSFNPVLIYGPSGSGKTHLLKATASALLSKGRVVHYVSAETFTQHVVRAIRSGMMQTFRKEYRFVDVLIVDGIDIFSGKAATQEEFFHTFNTLHTQEKSIILSSTAAPNQLKNIEERLISRFEWGITLPLIPLTDLSTLVKKKLETAPIVMQPAQIDFLLQTFSSPTLLVESLETLIYHCQLRDKASVERTSLLHILKDLIAKQKLRRTTPQKILIYVANYFDKTEQDIVGKEQAKEYVRPRQIAMYLIRKRLALSYTKIGETFNRDHSTVMTSIRNVEKSLETQLSPIANAVKSITHQLEEGS